MSTTQPRFAFLDSEGVLHLNDEEHAKQHGKHVQTSLTDDESGYPVIEGQGVVYHSVQVLVPSQRQELIPIAIKDKK
ncbi:hypothetical protein ABFT51_17320 [Paenibacillus peoriae]|uniref:hypothetical protein n=1 Tax=Paenibacillus peoriae TaxID=59893 RepID=UPI0032AF72A1